MRRRRALAYFQYTRTRTHSTVSMVVPLIPSLRTEQGLRQDWPLATLISCFSCFTGRSRWRGGTGTHETAAHNGRAPNELAISPILAREVPTKLRLPAGPAPPPPEFPDSLSATDTDVQYGQGTGARLQQDWRTLKPASDRPADGQCETGLSSVELSAILTV